MVSQFLYVESCGQCPACKFGTGEVTAYLDHIAHGIGTERDIELIGARLETVTDANRCYLGTQEQRVIASFLRAFPEDFVCHLERCSRGAVVPVPKLVDLSTASRSTTGTKRGSGRTGPTPTSDQPSVNPFVAGRVVLIGSLLPRAGKQAAGQLLQAGSIVSETINSERRSVAMHGARPRAALSVGTGVEVLNSFCAAWSGGFEVAETTPRGYLVRRVSDRYVLPVEFVADEVRAAF